jgi:hypothetical protein
LLLLFLLLLLLLLLLPYMQRDGTKKTMSSNKQHKVTIQYQLERQKPVLSNFSPLISPAKASLIHSRIVELA